MNSTDQYQSHRTWRLLRVFTVRALKVRLNMLKREYIEYPERSLDCTRCVEVIYAFVTSMQENYFFIYDVNPYKPSVLFVGHRKTMHAQISRSRTRHLIRVPTVCTQNVLLKFEYNENYHPSTLKTEMDWFNGQEWEIPFGLMG